MQLSFSVVFPDLAFLYVVRQYPQKIARSMKMFFQCLMFIMCVCFTSIVRISSVNLDEQLPRCDSTLKANYGLLCLC